MTKGFVLSLIVIGFASLLIILSVNMQTTKLEYERGLITTQPLSFAQYFFDDIGYDVSKIIDSNITIIDRNETGEIVIRNQKIPRDSFIDELNSYENFLENNTFNHTHSSFDLNFTNITNGTLKIYLLEEYTYQDQYSQNKVYFTNYTNPTNKPLSYSINITIMKERESVLDFEWDDGQNNTINVTLRYTDLNGSDVVSGELLPNELNTFRLDYVGADDPKVEVKIGDLGSQHFSGALELSQTNATVEYSFSTVIELITSGEIVEDIGYRYDSTIKYNQSEITKSSPIWR